MIKEFADMLSQAGVSAVLKQQLELASDKYEAVVAELDQAEYQNRDLSRELKSAHAKLYQQGEELEALRESTTDTDLPEDAQRALRILFENDIKSEDLAHLLSISPGKAKHYLDVLQKKNFACLSSFGMGGAFWDITSEGRTYVVDVIGEEEQQND